MTALAQNNLCPSRNVPLSLPMLEPCIAKLDFSQLKFKNTHSQEGSFTEENWDKAELEYRRFLQLKYLYPKAQLVPSETVDKVWHQHILDTKSYREDCNRIFGSFIDHYPYFGIYGEEDYSRLEQAFEETVKLYEMHFGVYENTNPLNAARCGGEHKCHVPGKCACRGPGTCK